MPAMENSDQFFSKLISHLVSQLGYEHAVAEKFADSIHLIKLDQLILVAECKSDFYRDTFVKSNLALLSKFASECWGEGVQFSLLAPNFKDEVPTKKRLTSKLKAENPLPRNLFDQNSQPVEAKQIADTPLVDLAPQEKITVSEVEPDRIQAAQEDLPRKLDPLFSFKTFVRGQSNQIAYSACEAVSKKPGHNTNPVFIFGPTGLGKTHLLHAVGQAIRANHPTWNIQYVTTGDFMNDFIASIRYQRTEAFRKRYRSCDVLLVDDIQFLENKEATQLEFFHTFNELHEKKKQIVITSDKYPKDIPNIEDRLKSRFLQGLIADIEPPGFEDRLAIIDSIARSFQLNLSQELVLHIAKLVKASVREIRGVLVNVSMHKQITGQKPSIQTINEQLKKMLKHEPESLDLSQIQKAVAAHFGIKLSEMMSASRIQKYVLPRHIAMSLAKSLLDLTTTQIAIAFGRKDHTTVMHALLKVKELIEEDVAFRSSFNEIRRKIEIT